MEIPCAAHDPTACLPQSKGPLLGGLAVMGTALAMHNALLGLVGALGCTLTFYGPCWSLTPQWRARRQALRWQHFVAGHDVLNLESPELLRLADAYDELVYTAGLSGVETPGEAGSVGHLMVLECATLLDGRTPAGPAELDYIAARESEIHHLTRFLADQHRAHTALEQRRALDRRRVLNEIARARTELENQTGVSAVFASRDLRRRYRP